MTRTQKITIFSTMLLAVLIVSATAYQLSRQQGVVTRTSGTALIGGSFELVDHKGVTVTDKDFAGKYTLVYFGYTFCPDVCPTELQVMTGALEQLGQTAKSIQPIFVTVDPERDTPEVMKEYVGNFFPGMIGLTGSAEQIAKVAKLYRVYYAKGKVQDGDGKDYVMDHSSIIYLMAPDGSFVKHFSYGTDPAKLAKGISEAIKG